MKTKLAFLAVTILVGFGSSSTVAGRDWIYFPATPKSQRTCPASIQVLLQNTEPNHANPSVKSATVTNRIGLPSPGTVGLAG